MPAILALLVPVAEAVFEILGLAATINGIVQAIRQVLNLNDTSSWANKVLANTAASATLLNDPTYGLGVVQSKLDSIQAALVPLGTPQQSTDPVILPTVPPAGYGGGGGGATAEEVWQYVSPFTAVAMVDELDTSYAILQQQDGVGGQQALFSPYFFVHQEAFNALLSGRPAQYPPKLDVSLITPTITLLELLEASNPGLDWFLLAEGNHYYHYYGDNLAYAFCLVDDAWLAALKAVGTMPAAGLAAPVWPGLANVTLGESQALSESTVVTGPLDGVIVALTSWPAGKSTSGYGSFTSVGRIGALIFIDDNGDAEFVQALNLTNEVYCPRVMAHAASAIVRAGAGVVGTVTPWTVA